MAATLRLPLSQPFLGQGSLSSSSLHGDGLKFTAPKLPLLKGGQPLEITAARKKWETKKCKTNSLPVRQKLHVKVGDCVKVISGGDKGKVTEVVRVYAHNSSVLVKDVNLKTKHLKGKSEGEAGQIVQVEAPIHSSNIMVYSKEQQVASRIGHKVLENGQKVRYLIKTGEVIDSPELWKKIHKEKAQGGKS